MSDRWSAGLLAATVVCAAAGPAPVRAQEPESVEVAHGRTYAVGTTLSVGDVLSAGGVDTGTLTEAFFTYNLTRAGLEADWILDGSSLGRTPLRRGKGVRAARSLSARLPALLEVRFVGEGGSVQVLDVGATVARRAVMIRPLRMPPAIDGSVLERIRRRGAAETPEARPEEASGTQERAPGGMAMPHIVEIDGLQTGPGVRLASALTSRIAVVAHDDPASGRAMLRPGQVSYDEFVIAGPMPLPGDLSDWFRNTAESGDDRRNGRVTIVDREREPTGFYRFRAAWPTALSVDVTTGTWSMTLVTEGIVFED